MATHHGRTYGFDLTGEKGEDGTHRSLARFTCTRCPAISDVTIKAGESLAPEAFVNTMRQRGWDAHATHRNRTLCPDCKRNKPVNDPDSEIKKMLAKNSNMTDTAIGSGVVPYRDPTIPERASIRDLLNKHFDEMDGAYHDEWDDNKIAEQLNLPRIMVERLRDAAYGPIRVSPELMKMRKVQNELRDKVNDLDATARSLLDTMFEDITKLRKEVEALNVKLHKVA
jgi:hypothetical protein